MSDAAFNRLWASVLVEGLTRHGVRHICIAPGSRSAPLALAAVANDRLICHTHIDERGLGFLALGLAKSSGERVALIVTSGTAAANLYPALIEATQGGERLIALTADRPDELIGCGANQAIDQRGMFSTHVVASLHLPRPTPDIPARWLLSSLDTLIARQQSGALHINCPFAEPLYGGADERWQAWRDEIGDGGPDRHPWLRYALPDDAPVMPDWHEIRQLRGVVLAGRIAAEEGKAVADWAARLGWPLLGDVQSQTGQPLASPALWLGHPLAQQQLSQAEVVVQFGASFTSRGLLQFQQQCRPVHRWLIDPLPGQRDPALHSAVRIQAAVGPWLVRHPAIPRQPWCPQLAGLVEKVRRSLAPTLGTFGEAQLASRLPELLPSQGAVFIGNSLSIRLVDALAQMPAGYPLYANRGASGIDGLIATAAGAQRGSGQPLLLLLGDLSALYDLNSLALLQRATAPLVIIVINNQGGQIFSLLPTPAALRERLFAMPPAVDFSHAAAAFGLHYRQVSAWETLAEAVQQGFSGGVTLIEVLCRGDEGARTLAALQQQAQCL